MRCPLPGNADSASLSLHSMLAPSLWWSLVDGGGTFEGGDDDCFPLLNLEEERQL